MPIMHHSAFSCVGLYQSFWICLRVKLLEPKSILFNWYINPPFPTPHALWLNCERNLLIGNLKKMRRTDQSGIIMTNMKDVARNTRNKRGRNVMLVKHRKRRRRHDSNLRTSLWLALYSARLRRSAVYIRTSAGCYQVRDLACLVCWWLLVWYHAMRRLLLLLSS